MPSRAKGADLSRLDPERLRRISESLPTDIAKAVRELANHAERGEVSATELQGLSDGLLAALPQLQALLGSVPGLDPASTTLPPELREGLAELRAGVSSPQVRDALDLAERHAQEVEAVGQALGLTIKRFKADLQEAGKALAEQRPPAQSTASAPSVKEAQQRLSSALAGFAAAIGRAAKAAHAERDPQAHALAELWLGTLAALSVPEANVLQQDAAQTCFEAALMAGELERGLSLATALTASAMAASDWEKAAVVQHTLADAARDAGRLTLLVQARSKEALLLAQTPNYAAVATQMMSEMRTLTASAPTSLQALALLHSGDVAQRCGQLDRAQQHWQALTKLPDVSTAEPELAGRAMASLGYLRLEKGKFKAAARFFSAALELAEQQGGWPLMGPAIRGQLMSLVQAEDRAGAQAALQHAKRLALAYGGQSGVVALADLAKNLDI